VLNIVRTKKEKNPPPPKKRKRLSYLGIISSAFSSVQEGIENGKHIQLESLTTPNKSYSVLMGQQQGHGNYR
jgi:hypothetical protein